MGLQVRGAQDATVQGNTNDIWCTRKQGIILPLGIPHHDPPLPLFLVVVVNDWEKPRDKENGRAKQRERVCPQTPAASNLPLFSSEAALALLGEFDGQLSVCQSIMRFLSHNRSLGAVLLISLLFRGMKIHIPPLHTDMSLSLPICLEEKWKSS